MEGSDFEAKAAAFHRSYQRRNGLAIGAVGVLLLLGSIIGGLLCIREAMQPEELIQNDRGDTIRLAFYMVVGFLTGAGMLWQATKLLRGRDD